MDKGNLFILFMSYQENTSIRQYRGRNMLVATQKTSKSHRRIQFTRNERIVFLLYCSGFHHNPLVCTYLLCKLRHRQPRAQQLLERNVQRKLLEDPIP